MERALILDTDKIMALLKALGETKAWLGKRAGVGRQWIHYDFKTGCTNRIHLYAKVFNLDPKDLIK